LSIRNIVKKNRRKSQTSQDKAVATNYHSHQTSGKNKTANFSLFFSGQIALEKFKSSAPKPFGTAFQTERQFGKGAIQVLRSLFTSGS
jgi:hypothetical protein